MYTTLCHRRIIVDGSKLIKHTKVGDKLISLNEELEVVPNCYTRRRAYILRAEGEKCGWVTISRYLPSNNTCPEYSLKFLGVRRHDKIWFEIVDNIIRAFPQVASTKDAAGNMPLHYIAQNKYYGTPELFERILVAYPPAAAVQDCDGYYPLHRFMMTWSAVYSDQMLDILFNDAHPETSNIRYAITIPNLSIDQLTRVLLQDLPIDKDGNPKEKHNFSWVTFLDPSNDFEVKLFYVDDSRAVSPLVLELVKNIFDHADYMPFRKRLAHAKDKKGRDLMHILSPEVQQLILDYILFLGVYDILDEPPIHMSPSSVIVRANEYFTSGEMQGQPKATVALKFMKSRSHYLREIWVRRTLLDNDSQSSVTAGNFVIPAVDLLENFNEEKFEEGVKGLRVGKYSLEEYRYGIAYLLAEKNLEVIYKTETPSLNEIRVYAANIASALKYLHGDNVIGIIHGDLTLKNVLRFNGKIMLTNFSASAYLKESDYDFCGAKFSSGALSPDFFYQFNDSSEEGMFNTYWQEEKTEDTELWGKIEPKRLTHAMPYVIKTFRTREVGLDNLQKPVEDFQLPYKPVQASTSIDVWSFGLLLYSLCNNGNPLLPVDSEDNLMHWTHMNSAAKWTSSSLKKMIDDIKLVDEDRPILQDLLYKILTRDNPVIFSFLLFCKYMYSY